MKWYSKRPVSFSPSLHTHHHSHTKLQILHSMVGGRWARKLQRSRSILNSHILIKAPQPSMDRLKPATESMPVQVWGVKEVRRLLLEGIRSGADHLKWILPLQEACHTCPYLCSTHLPHIPPLLMSLLSLAMECVGRCRPSLLDS